jgi:hypothetical protein
MVSLDTKLLDAPGARNIPGYVDRSALVVMQNVLMWMIAGASTTWQASHHRLSPCLALGRLTVYHPVCRAVFQFLFLQQFQRALERLASVLHHERIHENLLESIPASARRALRRATGATDVCYRVPTARSYQQRSTRLAGHFLLQVLKQKVVNARFLLPWSVNRWRLQLRLACPWSRSSARAVWTRMHALVK